MIEPQQASSTGEEPQQTRSSSTHQTTKRIPGKKFGNKQGAKQEAKTFKAHGGADKFRTAVDFKTQTRAQILPITTRGIGFMVNETVRRINAVAPNIDVPLAPLYRTALAQVHGKMIIANERQHHLSTTTTYAREFGDYSFLETLKAQPRHFNVVAQYINSIGNFKCGEIDYYVRYYDDFTLSPRIDRLFDNLRGLLLVNAANQARRTASAYNNSIPSAVYVVNQAQEGQEADPNTVHLRATNDVISQAYNVAQLRTDLETVSGFLERLGRKHERYIGNVNLNETGSCAQLVSTQLPAVGERPYINNNYANNTIVCRELINDVEDWYSTKVIPTNDFHTGVMLLCGEVPAPAEHQINAMLCMRTRATGIQSATQSWRDTFAACLN